jgi:hypothetical protein
MADKTEDHAKKTLARLEKDVFPWLGARPLAEIEAPEYWPPYGALSNAAQMNWHIRPSAPSAKYSDSPLPPDARQETPFPICRAR